MRTRLDGDYEIDDDFGRLDFRTLEVWLTASYWLPGIRLPEIVQGARNSALNLGEAHRRRGLARALVAAAQSHPDLAEVYTWLLATRDAQAVYAGNGFGPLPVPENWMIIRKEKRRDKA